jgi:hypothetical protein
MSEYAELRHGALKLRRRGLIERLSTVSTPLDFSHAITRLVSIGLALEGNAMLDWKADLERLVENATTFAKRVGVQAPIPRIVVEPDRMPFVNWTGSEREEIGYRIANFKAHQQRFKREREDYAASELKRITTHRY